jgi:hypothetical protein
MSSGESTAPRRFVVAEFGSSDTLLEATHKMREQGHTGLDTHTPYPVHGLEKALGISGVKVPTIVLVFGLLGACTAYGMMLFMNGIDFPLNTGNRPAHSPPAFVPITFELMVLFGGISAFVGVMALSGLPQPYHPVFEWDNFQQRACVDGFFLSVELPPHADAQEVAGEVRGLGAVAVEVIEEPEK